MAIIISGPTQKANRSIRCFSRTSSIANTFCPEKGDSFRRSRAGCLSVTRKLEALTLYPLASGGYPLASCLPRSSLLWNVCTVLLSFLHPICILTFFHSSSLRGNFLFSTHFYLRAAASWNWAKTGPDGADRVKMQKRGSNRSSRKKIRVIFQTLLLNVYFLPFSFLPCHEKNFFF